MKQSSVRFPVWSSKSDSFHSNSFKPILSASILEPTWGSHCTAEMDDVESTGAGKQHSKFKGNIRRDVMKTVSAFAGSLCLLMATSIQAGSVDKEAVTAFSGGTTISSAEMNTNFNTVIGAVDGNASDIATLQTSVDELKSRLDLLDAFITLEEMVGKTYCLVSDFTALTSTDSHSWLRVNNGTSSGILTISSSSEVSLAAADVNEAELGWSLGDGVNSQIQDQSTSDPAETLPFFF